jgi:hypothetical protein
MKAKMKAKLIIALVVIAIIAIPLNNYLIPTFGDYSDGERAGIVQKMTNRGMFVKTHEGELALEGIKSSANSRVSSVFEFSVTDKAVVDSLNANLGKMVKIYYKQYWHVNRFSGETDYFVSKVERVK